VIIAACIVGYCAAAMFAGVALYAVSNLKNDPEVAVIGGIFWPLVPPILSVGVLFAITGAYAERWRLRRIRERAERAALESAVAKEMERL
jgi:hypothetical protein